MIDHSPQATDPSFIIIGTQRGGTTSLYKYLQMHPQIVPAAVKEVHFFDHNFERGMPWYRSQFPVDLLAPGKITGEASPYYMFHPLAPERIRSCLPHVKLIALLRNPIDRALSQHHRSVENRGETLSFEAAVEAEPALLEGETERMIADPNYRSFNHQFRSYLSRGLYADQLTHWFRYFPQHQFLIVKSECFYENPPAILQKITDFLGISDWRTSVSFPANSYEPHNLSEYDPISPALRKRLAEFYRPHEARLSDLVGSAFHWNDNV